MSVSNWTRCDECGNVLLQCFCPSEDSGDNSKNPKDYAKRVRATSAVPIPASPDWNKQYRKVLRENGLTLSTSIREEEKSLYPSGSPVIAPWPYPLNADPDGYPESWPIGSLIIYDESASIDPEEYKKPAKND